jgi:DNA-directed RNA polymerase specialized sigma24 family protein
MVHPVHAEMLTVISRLRPVAMSLCRNKDQADDLVQDTLLRAWENITRYEPGTKMPAWLCTILRKGCIAASPRRTPVCHTAPSNEGCYAPMHNWQSQSRRSWTGMMFPFIGRIREILDEAAKRQQVLINALTDPYRPQLHYMRRPGPNVAENMRTSTVNRRSRLDFIKAGRGTPSPWHRWHDFSEVVDEVSINKQEMQNGPSGLDCRSRDKREIEEQ